MPARIAVFGLASLGAGSVDPLEEVVPDESLPEEQRRQAALALYWNKSEEALRSRGRLLGETLPESILVALETRRNWETSGE
jgi:hypothetical protein